MDRTKTLSEQLEAAGNDKNLQNLIFRYYQGLDMGDSNCSLNVLVLSILKIPFQITTWLI